MQQPWNFWSSTSLLADTLVCAHLLGALVIGVVLGYERSYKGHSAGMRTYALVCMASTGLVVICGLPAAWFGGHPVVPVAADPTRVIQGIVTGIGFLGAGVIVKDGMSIRGLSSAASIWMVSAIGIMIGVGFYGAAILMAALCLSVMSLVKQVEVALPHHSVIRLVIAFEPHHVMSIEGVRKFTADFGYQIMTLSCGTTDKDKVIEYDLVMESSTETSFNRLVDSLATTKDVVQFRVTPVQD